MKTKPLFLANHSLHFFLILLSFPYHTMGQSVKFNYAANGLIISKEIDSDPKQFFILGNTSVCKGDTVDLKISNGEVAKWSNGVSAMNTKIIINSDTTISAILTNKYGCEFSKSIKIFAMTKPTARITGSDKFCAGDSAVLLASGGDFYLWNIGSTNPSITVYNEGFYVVTVTNTLGCSSVISKQVTEIPKPTIPIITQIGDTLIVLNTTGRFNWFLNNTLIESGPNKIVTKVKGSYYVTVINGDGCKSTSTVLVLSSLTTLKHYNLSIFPNPTFDELYIANTSSVPIDLIEFYDLLGQLVLKIQQINPNNNKIGLSHFITGQYIIKIAMANGETYISKIIKL